MDSGVRHSVGGQDYGSVRAAAFMGLKIISGLARPQSHLAQAGPHPKEPPPIGSRYSQSHKWSCFISGLFSLACDVCLWQKLAESNRHSRDFLMKSPGNDVKREKPTGRGKTLEGQHSKLCRSCGLPYPGLCNGRSRISGKCAAERVPPIL